MNLYNDPETRRLVRDTTGSIKQITPFEKKLEGERIMEMGVRYMREHSLQFQQGSEEHYNFNCDFCVNVMPHWGRILVNGYLNDLNVVQAYMDFILKV